MVVVTLPVNEVFGPTFQGEGPHAGRRCWFVRLGLCNLACEWCDTPFTWDRTRFDLAAENPDRTVDWVHDELHNLDAHGGTLVVLSGGEPMIHALRSDFRSLLDPHWEWHVETNGTIGPPSWWRAQVPHTTVSPKVATSDPEKRRIKMKPLEAWADLAWQSFAAFKFVVTDPTQLDTVDELRVRLDLPATAVWVMAEGTTAGAVLAHQRALAPEVLARGYNLTTRLHTLLWDDERGR